MAQEAAGTLGEDEAEADEPEEDAMDCSEEACESEAGEDDEVLDLKDPTFW